MGARSGHRFRDGFVAEGELAGQSRVGRGYGQLLQVGGARDGAPGQPVPSGVTGGGEPDPARAGRTIHVLVTTNGPFCLVGPAITRAVRHRRSGSFAGEYMATPSSLLRPRVDTGSAVSLVAIVDDNVVGVAMVLLVVIPSKADTAYVPLLPVSSFNFVPKAHRLTASIHRADSPRLPTGVGPREYPLIPGNARVGMS